MDTPTQGKFKLFVSGFARRMKQHGFSRSGNWWTILEQGNCGFCNVQKSQANTRDSIKFTLNFGVIYGAIIGSQPVTHETVKNCNSHVWFRPGELVEPYDDLWWTIDEQTDLDALLEEIILLVEGKAIEHLHWLLVDSNMIEKWETELKQGELGRLHTEYLAQLKNKAKGNVWDLVAKAESQEQKWARLVEYFCDGAAADEERIAHVKTILRRSVFGGEEVASQLVSAFPEALTQIAFTREELELMAMYLALKPAGSVGYRNTTLLAPTPETAREVLRIITGETFATFEAYQAFQKGKEKGTAQRISNP